MQQQETQGTGVEQDFFWLFNLFINAKTETLSDFGFT